MNTDKSGEERPSGDLPAHANASGSICVYLCSSVVSPVFSCRCDSSPHRHATAHCTQVGHPVVASFEPGERWAWCYADEAEVPLPDAALPYLRA